VNAANLNQLITSLPPRPAPGPEQIEAVFHRDYSLDDGRFSNNGWMQELPDPITKVTWDNVVQISRATAQARGFKNGDMVEIANGNNRTRGPIWVQPGLADNTVALALGYGRLKTGRVGRNAGFNVYLCRTSQAPYIASGVTLTKTGQTYPVF